jgi:predicted RND superfamily exporter protein
MLPTVHFGLFSAFIIVVALIGDLLFLPAFVYLFDKEMNQESTDAKTSESVQKAEQPVAS